MSTPDNTDTSNDSYLNNAVVLTIIWSLSGVLFLCAPVCLHQRRRTICLSRIRERRWNVHVPPERHAEWYRRALERYEQGRVQATATNRTYSPQEEDEIRQIFLLERMAEYTKMLQEDDIVKHVSFEGDEESPVVQRVPEEEDSVRAMNRTDATETTVEESHISSVQPSVPTSSSVERDHAIVENDQEAQTSSEEFVAVPVEEFQNAENGCITVPLAGEIWSESSNMQCRQVANGCAVCLCEYDVLDRVTWASNKECSHVFHEECILNWLLSQGRKKQRCRRNHPNESTTGDPLMDATTFPMVCPCCRQDYIIVPGEGEGTEATAIGVEAQEQSPPFTPDDAIQV